MLPDQTLVERRHETDRRIADRIDADRTFG